LRITLTSINLLRKSSAAQSDDRRGDYINLVRVLHGGRSVGQTA
jgi:hypothetical protein